METKEDVMTDCPKCRKKAFDAIDCQLAEAAEVRYALDTAERNGLHVPQAVIDHLYVRTRELLAERQSLVDSPMTRGEISH